MADEEEIEDLTLTTRPEDAENIDARLENADWTKGTWDMPDVDTVEKLRARLKAQGMSVPHFKTLPVFQRNKDKLPWLREL
jgi:hypothetical protein